MIRGSRQRRVLAALTVAAMVCAPYASAQETDESYDDQLMRLAEILGAIHHLRDICGFDEGQLWREKMLELLEVEDPPGQFRARMIASFNNGYRGFRRTYLSCTGSAKTAENRFFTEGAQIAADLTIRLSAPDDGEGGEEVPTEGGQ